MHRAKRIELTNLCLIYDGDKILVQEREWRGEKGIIFPGGHVEDGESMLAAVTREMKEETGLTVLDPVICGLKQFYKKDGARYVIFLFKATKYCGELKSSDEGEVFFIDRDEIECYKQTMHFDSLLRVFDDEKTSEFQYIREDDGSYRLLLH
jgi:8-oxo-dGTP diphosphatase